MPLLRIGLRRLHYRRRSAPGTFDHPRAHRGRSPYSTARSDRPARRRTSVQCDVLPSLIRAAVALNLKDTSKPKPVPTKNTVRLVTIEVARRLRIGSTHRVRRRFVPPLAPVLGSFTRGRCTWRSSRFDTSWQSRIVPAVHGFASHLDRVLWAWLSQRWHGWRAALHVVQPATVLAWHRRGFRLFWTWKSRHRTGRPGGASRRPRVDSRNVHGEPPLGRTSNSRRAPEVGNLSESVDRCQIHAPAATAAVANVADLPHQSCKPDHGRGPVRRADGHVSAALCARDPRARPSTNRPRRGHRASNRGLDGTTASQCLFGERDTAVSPPRSRFGLCRRGDHHRGDEYSGRSYGAAIAVAERVR